MRIVFMGTPDFAEESLRALLEAGEDIAAFLRSRTSRGAAACRRAFLR